MSLKIEQISRSLSKVLLRKKHTRIMMDYFREKLPRLVIPESVNEWNARVSRIRKELVSKVYMKGHTHHALNAKPKVQWRGVIETGRGYRIRKLRYEGYPGMWIPALLYEPTELKGKVPAVLNPNGHHRGGKAMPYKQARCINLAKRGMLALNTEFIGMGELQGAANHMSQGHMDLCGVAGVGAMYLAMKRGLDVLLAHKNADPDRVAMTGLSGGGWQTAVLSAIDERITAILPVSGHSPIWQRAIDRWEDHGDLEQTPVDLCTVTDFDTMTAMFAPRPSLLIHSVNDSIFRPEFMRPSIYQPARKVYKFLGVEDRIGFYANEDPGDHNYERDIREQLYKFLNDIWNLDIPTEEIPCDDEIRSELELNVGLPTDNPNYFDIAANLSQKLPRKGASAKTKKEDRNRLREVLRLPRLSPGKSELVGKPQTVGNIRIQHHILNMSRWEVPVTEFKPADAGRPLLILSGSGRAKSSNAVKTAIDAGRHVFVADLFGFGEQVIDKKYHYLFMECVAAAGDRPLGICTAQLLALLKWVRSLAENARLEITAQGLSCSLIALCAAALSPSNFGKLNLFLPDSLRRLIDWQVDYEQEPVMFCFGLLEQFDIEDLIVLSHPAGIEIGGRGPIR
ncbi:MAG: acetylxylan esterase [Planctomycetota bacterium]|nr:acetylxylan esterase [Planctomycetota bacterium]